MSSELAMHWWSTLVSFETTKPLTQPLKSPALSRQTSSVQAVLRPWTTFSSPGSSRHLSHIWLIRCDRQRSLLIKHTCPWILPYETAILLQKTKTLHQESSTALTTLHQASTYLFDFNHATDGDCFEAAAYENIYTLYPNSIPIKSEGEEPSYPDSLESEGVNMEPEYLHPRGPHPHKSLSVPSKI